MEVQENSNMNNPKLLIIGHKRHGKDTVSEIFQKKYKLSFASSSLFILENTELFEILSKKYGYLTKEECFNDRDSKRKEWFDFITNYNTPDKTRLGKSIFETNDIYCGLRNRQEFVALQGENVFDYSIWVDRRQHLPEESKDSMELTKDDADFFLDNNGNIWDLHFNVSCLYNKIMNDFNGEQHE